ncbi:MAG: NACHT domain-containing protein, partial [Acidobacteria bacterium]
MPRRRSTAALAFPGAVRSAHVGPRALRRFHQLRQPLRGVGGGASAQPRARRPPRPGVAGGARPGGAGGPSAAAPRRPRLLLLDGLDEVPAERRRGAENLIRDLAGRWPESPLVATTRPIGYRSLGAEFRRLDVLPLDSDKRRRFLARWLSPRPGEPDPAAADRAEQALAHLEADRNLWEPRETFPVEILVMLSEVDPALLGEKRRQPPVDQPYHQQSPVRAKRDERLPPPEPPRAGRPPRPAPRHQAPPALRLGRAAAPPAGFLPAVGE